MRPLVDCHHAASGSEAFFLIAATLRVRKMGSIFEVQRKEDQCNGAKFILAPLPFGFSIRPLGCLGRSFVLDPPSEVFVLA